MSQLWEIAVDAPLLNSLSYQVPENRKIERGQKVFVPLRNRQVSGIALEKKLGLVNYSVKEIIDIDDSFPLLPEHYLQWLEWLADYYIYPKGSVVHLAFPPLKNKKTNRKSNKTSPIPSLSLNPKKLILNSEQTKVIEDISKHADHFSTHLLFGVTGSGKTEVYMGLLEKTLEQGKSGIVLVPEISLTPQLTSRFANRFGDQIALIHSQLTPREKTNQWWEIVEGRKKILIGARSALFCPAPNLGLIIVDEEHEASFKQDEKLKYHGRDAAIMLAKFNNCPVVLGSATPSLESWKNVQDKKYILHELKSRIAEIAMPSVEVVDLRKTDDNSSFEKKNPDRPYWLSDTLSLKISETLANQKQVALFLNRRGMAQTVLCPSCGFSFNCPNCDIKLTLHGQSHLVCHYCDYHENMKKKCPDCHEGEIRAIGLGTELVESEMKKLFPFARIARADRDEITSREDMEDLIQRMDKNEIDILIGTQMIAKGLDFPNLSLVGLILADVGFNLPDFRATERSFQLITQMAGRAGRHGNVDSAPGQVIVQTFNREHPSIEFAKNHDFPNFAIAELQNREQLNYPPFGRLVCLRTMGSQLTRVQISCDRLKTRALQLKNLHSNYHELNILGPCEAPIAKIRNQFRFQFFIKGKNATYLNHFVRQLLGDESWLEEGTRILVDVDPINLL